MSLSRALALKLIANTRDFERDLKGSGKAVDKLGARIKGFGKMAAGALAGVAVAAAYMGAKIGIDAIQAASNLNEAMSKMNVIFGTSASTIEAFSKTTAKSIGIGQTAALDAASTFAIFGKGAGLTGKKLADFSTDFVTLAADLASFNNTSPEEAITAIGSALRGENEPIRKYGVLINDAALKQEALTMGIYNGKGALTAQQKTLAASKLIYKQTSDAQGDFARTSDGLAGSQKTLSAVWDDIQIQIGQALMPAFTGFVDWLKTDGVDGITTFIDVMQGGTGKNLQQAILGGKKDMDGFTYGAMSENQTMWINLADSVKDMAKAFEKLFKKLDLGNPKSSFNKMIDGLSSMADSLATITDAFSASDATDLQELQDSGGFGTVLAAIRAFIGVGIDPNQKRAMGGPVRTGTTYLVGEQGPELFTPGAGGGHITPNHKLGGGNTYITVNALDPTQAARAVQSALNKASRVGVSRFAGAAN